MDAEPLSQAAAMFGRIQPTAKRSKPIKECPKTMVSGISTTMPNRFLAFSHRE
jgi:hypothetical protein